MKLKTHHQKNFANTSNTKFFPICASVYNNKYNFVSECPSDNDIKSLFRNNIYSRHKDKLPVNDKHLDKKCKNC